MESFYGGRQGASFVIKQKFDYIGEIVEGVAKTFFRYGDYLYDINNRGFIVDDQGNLISRLNYNNPLSNTQKWKLIYKDGNPITGQFFTLEGVEYKVPKGKEIKTEQEKATTMLECFSQGIATTNEVNYGEYVIIDAQRSDEMGKDNGKDVLINGRVYRRTLNYKNAMCGAEFIGQIVGPQGQSPELFFDSFEMIKNGNEATSKDNYIKIIQGTANNKNDTNFKIRYEKNPENLNGINEYRIGFQVPYAGFNFKSKSVNYTEDSKTYIEPDAGQHNFYYPYEVTIPNGVPGDDIDQVFEVCENVNTMEKNIDLYIYTNGIYTKADIAIPRGTVVNTIINDLWLDEEQQYVAINYIPQTARATTQYYVLKTDTYKLALYTRLIKYDKKDTVLNGVPQPTIQYECIARDYKRIKGFDLAQNGQLTALYAGEKVSEIVNIDNPIQWIESTQIVDETSYLALVQKGFDADTIPSIGSVIVKYNTNNLDNPAYYFYMWNGEYQKVWTKVGEAQDLTGLKIFKTEENGFDKIKEYATSVPAGWGVFIPAEKISETGEYSKAYIVIKNGYGSGYNNPDSWPKIFIEDLGVGRTPELITPTNYATGVKNLEQELLFGKDTYIEEYLDNKGNKVTEISYYNENTIKTDDKYYKVKTIMYKEDQMEPTLVVDENGVLKNIVTGKYATFDKNNGKLSLVSSKHYQYIDNKLSMASEKKMKTDILYLVTVGNPNIEEEILVKETIVQEAPNGRKIIKEQNVIKSKGDN